MKVSIVLPIYNEEKNIPILYKEITDTCRKSGYEYEIIAVNDSSTDLSPKVLSDIAHKDPRLKVISFKFNVGQTAAMSAGIHYATGDIIIPMDSDLQNDPRDIPRFIDKIHEGYDVVSGWRKDRKDFTFSRKIPSKIANVLIGYITGVKIHDYGCSMKAYRRELIQDIKLYGEMHRFIPAYARWQGGRVAEIVTNHRPRIHGKTNYGISRTFKVLLDLVVVKFLSRYLNKPIHFFGGVGFVSLAIGVVAGISSIFLKIFHAKSFVSTPLPVFSALFIIVGVQLMAMGIIAEMLMRIYYESQNATPYKIRETINI